MKKNKTFLINRDKGMVFLIICLMVSFVFITFFVALNFMNKINMKSSLHYKLAGRAIEVCDVGISQLIGDIHRHAVNLTLLPFTTTYAVAKYPESGETENVNVTLEVVPDTNDVDGDGDTTEPETDLEGNNIYKIDAESMATLATGEALVKRHVASRISIVHLANYNLFYVGDDVWGNFSTPTSGIPIMLDGRYHTNGNISLAGVIYFNNQYLPANPGVNNTPGATLNATYSPQYTVMTAKSILQLDDPAVYLSYPNTTYTQNNQIGYLSINPSYSVCPTATHLRGTWFDQAHGGFEIHLESLDFSWYRGIAQVTIDRNDLPNFTVYGAIYSSNDLLINNGAGTQVVDIDLSFLGSGTSKDVCAGSTNYLNALQSTYGLMIFVRGPVAVHGKLANCSGANNNKKVIIITTDTVDILGDILYSGDAYMQILDSFSTHGSVTAWGVDSIDADCNTQRYSADPVFVGAPYKNVDSSCMRVRIKSEGAVPQVTLKKHFSISPPPAGINNNKIFFNIRADNVGDTAQVTLQLKDNIGGVIASTGPVTVDHNWRRMVLVNNQPDTTLNLSQITNFNNNSGDNLEIIFTAFDANWRDFYIDELGFAFGKSYPIDYSNANPTNDAIGLISQDNIYENAYYMYNANPSWHSNWLFINPPTPKARTESIKYFAVNGDYTATVNIWGTNYNSLYYDLRMDNFIYTGIPGSMFTVHTNQYMNMFSMFGATTSHAGGMVRAPVFNNVFDPLLSNNISKAIPIGTVIHTYQQVR